jgi:thiamine-phosphate pyrophosphorylase
VPDTGADRRAKLAQARLYLVSDARQESGDLAGFLDSVLASGVDVIQLREKSAEAGDLLRWSAVFRETADRHGGLFILNDRPDVAVAADADGVHLGQNDLPLAAARHVVGRDRLIGISTHGERDFASAPEADYLCAGPVYETPTKPGRTATGLGLIRAAAARVSSGVEERPWFAIGGIDGATLDDVLEAGAERVVVVRAICAASDPAAAARALSERLDEKRLRATLRANVR